MPLCEAFDFIWPFNIFKGIAQNAQNIKTENDLKKYSSCPRNGAVPTLVAPHDVHNMKENRIYLLVCTKLRIVTTSLPVSIFHLRERERLSVQLIQRLILRF